MNLLTWENQFKELLSDLAFQSLIGNTHISFQSGSKGNCLVDVIFCFIAKSIGLEIPKDFFERVKADIGLQGNHIENDIDNFLLQYFRNLAFGDKINFRFNTDIEITHFLENLNWNDPWNEINIVGTVLKSFIDKGETEKVKVVFRFIQDSFSIDNNLSNIKNISPLQMFGVWSHLVPFESLSGAHFIERNKKTFDFVLSQQNQDYHFYPVTGGGACPNLNAVNILMTFCINSDDYFLTTCEKLTPLIQTILSGISQPLIAESLRTQPMTIKEVSKLRIGAEVKLWVTCKEIFEIGSKTEFVNLYKPEVWSTWIWLLTVKKINLLLTDKSKLKITSDHFSFGLP
ncbi:MAG: hypothetical protein WCP32_01940 [Bacteroidota bacterium]